MMLAETNSISRRHCSHRAGFLSRAVFGASLTIGLLPIAGVAQHEYANGQRLTKDTSITRGPAPAVRNLNDVLETIRQHDDLPALAAAIVKHDRVVAIGAVGRRNIDHPEPVTTNDVFQTASCGKAMTATLCAMLV